MNYREQTATGTLWRRCHQVVLDNPLGGNPSARFDEQDVVSVGDSRVVSYAGYLQASFDPNAAFPVLDPQTLQPTGEMMTHAALYRAQFSLYMHLAKTRDQKEQKP